MIGIDEVGRGAWAGPLLVVAARNTGTLPDGVADSKTISKLKREKLSLLIQDSCGLGQGWVEPGEIDELGLTGAMRLAVERALHALHAERDEEIIMDGHINYCPVSYTNVQAVVDADVAHPIVSAASIYAKVTRDTYMAGLAKTFPQYGLESHVGYGTSAHRQAIHDHGVTPIHRRSYAPIKMLLYSKQARP